MSKRGTATSTPLPGRLLSLLYQDAIVQPTLHAGTASQADSLGGYSKRILILVCQPEAAVIQEASLSFLLNILHACRLGMPDVRLINLAHMADKDHQELSRVHTPRIVLIFGAASQEIGLPMRFPDYQVQEFEGIRYLTAPPLDQLERDMPSKKLLWVALKKVFPL
ncbi:MAG: hypothetical protein FJX89_02325 [Bacteroidetes bacterium]|nr:hypothetical protein [Bacteroidota bacterium]